MVARVVRSISLDEREDDRLTEMMEISGRSRSRIISAALELMYAQVEVVPPRRPSIAELAAQIKKEG